MYSETSTNIQISSGLLSYKVLGPDQKVLDPLIAVCSYVHFIYSFCSPSPGIFQDFISISPTEMLEKVPGRTLLGRRTNNYPKNLWETLVNRIFWGKCHLFHQIFYPSKTPGVLRSSVSLFSFCSCMESFFRCDIRADGVSPQRLQRELGCFGEHRCSYLSTDLMEV